MLTTEDVLFLDTETTGVPDRNAQWDEDYQSYPHIVQLAWMHGTKMESHIIRPEGWEIPDEAIEVHGITNEEAQKKGEPFALVIDLFLADCAEATLLCGHNIHFDTSIIKANILRELGREYYDANEVEELLFKGKRIDTMRPTMKWVDARTQWGRLKFPKLEELYSRCFPGETFPAHNALEDVKAVAKCLPVILAEGLVELKVKEYPAEQLELPRPEAAEKIVESAKQKFGNTENIPESPKTTPNLSDNLKNEVDITPNAEKPQNAPNKEIADLLNQEDF